MKGEETSLLRKKNKNGKVSVKTHAHLLGRREKVREGEE